MEYFNIFIPIWNISKMRKENIYKQLRESTETDSKNALTQTELAAIFKEEGNPLSQSTISKLEKQQKEPPSKSPDVIKAYATHFNVTADYLLGIRENAIADEDLAMIGKVTGLSDDAIEMLKILTNYRHKSKNFLPGLGADIDVINILLEYQYLKTKQAKAEGEGGYYPMPSVLHYIRQYLSSGIYEREPLDRLRIYDGEKWIDIKEGDILIKGNKKHTIACTGAINSESNACFNAQKMNIINTEDKKECYTVDVNQMFQSYSRDEILKELDDIKVYIEKKKE